MVDTRESLGEFESSIFDASDGHKLVDLIRKKKGLHVQTQKIFDDVPSNRPSLQIEIQRLDQEKEISQPNKSPEKPAQLINVDQEKQPLQPKKPHSQTEIVPKSPQQKSIDIKKSSPIIKIKKRSLGRRTLLKEFEKAFLDESRFVPEICSTPISSDLPNNINSTNKNNLAEDHSNENSTLKESCASDNLMSALINQNEMLNALVLQAEKTSEQSDATLVNESQSKSVRRSPRRTYTVECDISSGKITLSPAKSKQNNEIQSKTFTKKVNATQLQRNLLMEKFGLGLSKSSPTKNVQECLKKSSCIPILSKPTTSNLLSNQGTTTEELVKNLQKNSTPNCPVIVIPVNQTFNQAPINSTIAKDLTQPDNQPVNEITSTISDNISKTNDYASASRKISCIDSPAGNAISSTTVLNSEQDKDDVVEKQNTQLKWDDIMTDDASSSDENDCINRKLELGKKEKSHLKEKKSQKQPSATFVKNRLPEGCQSWNLCVESDEEIQRPRSRTAKHCSSKRSNDSQKISQIEKDRENELRQRSRRGTFTIAKQSELETREIDDLQKQLPQPSRSRSSSIARNKECDSSKRCQHATFNTAVECHEGQEENFPQLSVRQTSDVDEQVLEERHRNDFQQQTSLRTAESEKKGKENSVLPNNCRPETETIAKEKNVHLEENFSQSEASDSDDDSDKPVGNSLHRPLNFRVRQDIFEIDTLRIKDSEKFGTDQSQPNASGRDEPEDEKRKDKKNLSKKDTCKEVCKTIDNTLSLKMKQKSSNNAEKSNKNIEKNTPILSQPENNSKVKAPEKISLNQEEARSLGKRNSAMNNENIVRQRSRQEVLEEICSTDSQSPCSSVESNVARANNLLQVEPYVQRPSTESGKQNKKETMKQKVQRRKTAENNSLQQSEIEIPQPRERDHCRTKQARGKTSELNEQCDINYEKNRSQHSKEYSYKELCNMLENSITSQLKQIRSNKNEAAGNITPRRSQIHSNNNEVIAKITPTRSRSDVSKIDKQIADLRNTIQENNTDFDKISLSRIEVSRSVKQSEVNSKHNIHQGSRHREKVSAKVKGSKKLNARDDETNTVGLEGNEEERQENSPCSSGQEITQMDKKQKEKRLTNLRQRNKESLVLDVQDGKERDTDTFQRLAPLDIDEQRRREREDIWPHSTLAKTSKLTKKRSGKRAQKISRQSSKDTNSKFCEEMQENISLKKSYIAEQYGEHNKKSMPRLSRREISEKNDQMNQIEDSSESYSNEHRQYPTFSPPIQFRDRYESSIEDDLADEISTDRLPLDVFKRPSEVINVKKSRKPKKMSENVKNYLKANENVVRTEYLNVSKRKLYSKGNSDLESSSESSFSKQSKRGKSSPMYLKLPSKARNASKRISSSRKNDAVAIRDQISESLSQECTPKKQNTTREVTQNSSQTAENERYPKRSREPQNNNSFSSSSSHNESTASQSPTTAVRKSNLTKNSLKTDRRLQKFIDKDIETDVENERESSTVRNKKSLSRVKNTKSKSSTSNKGLQQKNNKPNTNTMINEEVQNEVITKPSKSQSKKKISKKNQECEMTSESTTNTNGGLRRSTRERKQPTAYWACPNSGYTHMYDIYNMLTAGKKPYFPESVTQPKSKQKYTKKLPSTDDNLVSDTNTTDSSSPQMKTQTKQQPKVSEPSAVPSVVVSYTSKPKSKQKAQSEEQSTKEGSTTSDQNTHRLSTIDENTHRTTFNSNLRTSEILMPPPETAIVRKASRINRKNAFRKEHDDSIADVSSVHVNYLFDQLINASANNTMLDRNRIGVNSTGPVSQESRSSKTRNLHSGERPKKVSVRLKRMDVSKDVSSDNNERNFDSGFSSEEMCSISTKKDLLLDWLVQMLNNGKNSSNNQGSTLARFFKPEGFMTAHVDQLMFEEIDGVDFAFYDSPGLKFGYVRFKPKTEKKLSVAKRYELNFVLLGGTIQMTIGNQTFDMKNGDLVTIFVGTKYRMKNITDEPALAMVIRN